MTNTPRTDAVAQRVIHLSEVTEMVRADFARRLERELADEKAHHTRTDQKWQRSYNQAVAERIKETNRADAKDALIAKLREALRNMVNHYTRLVNSGDAGNWCPEDEDVVKLSREALGATFESASAELTALRDERDAYRITLQQISAFANSELRSTPEAIMAANALKTKATP